MEEQLRGSLAASLMWLLQQQKRNTWPQLMQLNKCHGIILEFTYLCRRLSTFEWSTNFENISQHLNSQSTNGNWWPNWQLIPLAKLVAHSPRHTTKYQVSKTMKISLSSCSLVPLPANLD